MKKTSKRFMLIAACTLGLLAGCILLFERAIRISKIERNAPYSASYSAADAGRLGTLVRRVHVSPAFLTWKERRISIDDAWIERISDIEYTLLFFQRRTFRNEYRLVVLPGVSTSPDYNFWLADRDTSYFSSQSSGLDMSFVLTYDLGKQYPDTMYFLALDGKQVKDRLRFVAL